MMDSDVASMIAWVITAGLIFNLTVLTLVMIFVSP